jgi:hypothetical protein
MIETIRNWNPNGNIRIKYVDGQGNANVWEYDTRKLLAKIIDIVNAYSSQEIKLTNRQLYYQLVATDIIPNAEATYKRICTFLTDARYGGLINWDAIEDRGRTPERHSEWDNIQELVQSAVYAYRKPRWIDQEYYIELYSEKQAMESVLKPIADKYHIYFGCNKGYSSASTMYELAKRLGRQQGKKLVILYLGDHDPSGLDMIRDIAERTTEFLWYRDVEEYDNDYGLMYETRKNDGVFQVIPVALKSEQIKMYNPPPNPAKITDPRAKWYLSRYGQSSWELDALKPEVLIKLTEKAILDFIDIDKYDAIIDEEKQEISKLVTLAKKIK